MEYESRVTDYLVDPHSIRPSDSTVYYFTIVNYECNYPIPFQVACVCQRTPIIIGQHFYKNEKDKENEKKLVEHRERKQTNKQTFVCGLYIFLCVFPLTK